MFITPGRRRALAQELAAIGERHSFLHDERTKPIGRELNRRGGRRLMLRVHREVSALVSREDARELEFAWDGIGKWLG
jgi:hypothetical protein